jgi:hypothetical protein
MNDWWLTGFQLTIMVVLALYEYWVGVRWERARCKRLIQKYCPSSEQAKYLCDIIDRGIDP